MKKRYFIILFTSLIITSCSSTKPEEVDLQKQFDRATNYLEKKRYMRAQEEFNSVAIRGLHTDLGDDAQFFLGESYFLNKEYILAIAEYVTKVHAVCTKTGKMASYTHRIVDNDELILLGDIKKYEALSRKAFNRLNNSEDSGIDCIIIV